MPKYKITYAMTRTTLIEHVIEASSEYDAHSHAYALLDSGTIERSDVPEATWTELKPETEVRSVRVVDEVR